jgi:hypothetical protein
MFACFSSPETHIYMSRKMVSIKRMNAEVRQRVESNILHGHSSELLNLAENMLCLSLQDRKMKREKKQLETKK